MSILPENSSLSVFSFSDAHEIVNSVEQYPVDFDDLWVWCGYSRKDSALRILQNEMAETIDFAVSHINEEDATAFGGYRKTTKYWLNVDAAKSLALTLHLQKEMEIVKC